MNKSPLRILFMGSPAIAVPYLDFLQQSCHEVVGVLTRPDRPAGRGLKLHPCAVAARARELGLSLFQPDNLSTPPFAQTIQALKVDLAIVVAYGKILKTDMLQAPRHRIWNVHFSLLPQYRGAAPFQWALINGESRTGVTIIRLVEKMDAGPILGQQSMEILTDDNAATLGERLSGQGVALLAQTLESLQAGSLKEIPQNDSEATYAPMLKKEDGQIDWSESAQDLCNRIRGLNPWPVAKTVLPPGPSIDRIPLKIYSAEKVTNLPYSAPGTVLEADAKQGLVIACSHGALKILELQPAGKKRMKATDFLRGHKIEKGTKLL